MTELFLTFLNMSIAASWTILAVLLLRPLLRKAPKWITSLLWAIPALRLLIPVFWESDISLLPSAQVFPTDIAQAETPIIYSGISEVNSAVNPILTRQADGLTGLLETLSVIWLIGAGLLLVYSLVSWLRLRFTVRASMLLRDRVYICDDVKSPFILGIFRPRIYLPSGLEEPTVTHVLAHEDAHLKRMDHIWKPFGYLLLSIYWFNPLMWVAYILLCRDIERACDEKVLQHIDGAAKLGYAKALVDCSTHRRMILTCPVAFGEVGVKSRIKAVLSYKKPAFWVILVAITVSILTSACFLTNPKACAHSYEGQVTLASTCTDQGNETFTCRKCSHSYMAMTAVCDHSYGEPLVLIPSDCATQGTQQLTCADCGHVTTVQLPLAPDAHDLHTVTETKPACGIPGKSKTTCTRCSFTEYKDIPALEHSYELTERVEPNCSHSGKEIYTCKLCDHQVKKRLPRNGQHNWQRVDRYVTTCSYCHSWTSSYRGNGADILEQMNNTFTGESGGGIPKLPSVSIEPVLDPTTGRLYFP